MQKPKSILGIDLRVNSVKVVELESRPDGQYLVNWAAAAVPYNLIDKHPEKENAQAKLLSELIASKGFSAREAVVVLGGGEAAVKLFAMQEVSREELSAAIKWKFAEEVKYPIEDALVDFYQLDGHDHLAACINRQTYNEINSVLSRSGIKLVALTILPDALQKVLQPEISKEKGKILSLICMGQRTTNITILKKGEIEFNRELNIGGENITLAMSGVLVSNEGQVEISPEQAEKIKVEHGIPLDLEKYPKLPEIPLGQLQAMVRPALERIQDEIMRTFEYYKGQTGEAAVDKIILTGGSSLTPNLATFLSTGLGIPVVCPATINGWRPDEALPDKEAFDKYEPRLVGAIGAALISDTKINLLPDDVKLHWQVMRQKILRPEYLLAVAVILLLLIYGLFSMSNNNLRGQVNKIDKKINEYKPKLAAFDNLEKSAQQNEKRRVLAQAMGEKRPNLALLLEELGRLAPKAICLKNLEYTDNKLHIIGESFVSNGAAEINLSKYLLELSRSTYLRNVKLVEAKKSETFVDEAFQFDIMAEIKWL